MLHLERQRATVALLQSRIRASIAYLQDVVGGTLPADHAILREINSLVSQLPHLQGSDGAPDLPSKASHLLYKEYTDILLWNYLSSLTKCSSQLMDLTATHEVAQRNAVRAKDHHHSPYQPSKECRFKERRARR